MSIKFIGDIDGFRVPNVSPSAFYISEFVSTAEESVIMSNIYSSPKPKWTQLSNRRLQNWGGIPHSKGMIAETIPPWLDTYLERIHKLDVMDGKRPNHVLVNEYLSGQGIMPHLDGSLFYPTITTISLGSHIVLKFLEPNQDESDVSMLHAFSLLLEPRSLLILQDELFSHYLHCIEEVTEDVLGDKIANLDMCSDTYTRGATIPRDTRISLTIRHVPKTTTFKLNIELYKAIPKRFFSSEVTKDDCPNEETSSSDEKPLDGKKKGLVLGVYEAGSKFELTAAAEEANQKSGGKLCQHLSSLSSELKLGKAFVVTDLLPEYSAVALASLGPKDPGFDELEQLDKTRENVRIGVGAGVRALQRRGCASAAVDAAAAPDAAAEAAELAAWRFQEFKSCGDRSPEMSVSPYGGQSAEWGVGAVRARAQNWARYLSDMPANNMTPVDLAQAALDTLCPLGVQVEARDRDWIVAQNMRAFLAVARGSCETPMFLECVYKGAGEGQPPVLIVAKGVTFDSGGLCLKPRRSMSENRGSMAGAAVALAALRTIAQLKVPINVVACVPLCENMVSGQCMKVGDVVRALNGLSIQIEDTDMEGRLMMADALVYGQATFRPAFVMDIGTLTHGVLLATGGGAFGAFSNSGAAWAALRRAGALSGDRPWRFPLWAYYQRQVTDDPSVDLRNKGSGKATPCIGAAFLRNFVCVDWLHLDITGVGKVAHGAPPYLRARRMTGRPTRTVAMALGDIAEACRKDRGKEDARKAH